MRYIKRDLTWDELIEKIIYLPDKGLFYSFKMKNPIGHYLEGHLYIHINDKKYSAKRLAFLYMNKYNPEHHMIHKNGDNTDYRWENLIETSWACITRNKNSKKIVKGVSYNKRDDLYISQLKANGKFYTKHFKTFNDAVLARYNLEQTHLEDCEIYDSDAFNYLSANKLI